MRSRWAENNKSKMLPKAHKISLQNLLLSLFTQNSDEDVEWFSNHSFDWNTKETQKNLYEMQIILVTKL